jgi:hypothetical protein
MKSVTYQKGYVINEDTLECVLMRLPGTEQASTKKCAITPKNCKKQVKIL